MRTILAPFGLAYGELASLRRRFYSLALLKSERLLKPVVSIGNLTVGGTGKTPVVDAILEQIEKQGLSACVLSRGYGRKNSISKPLLLSQSTKAIEGGDEPVWLARRHPKSVVAVHSDRIASSTAVPNVDLYILDDGHQHLQIQRDLDIVLLDCTRPFWHYHPLPWGYAREGFSSLQESDIVILTRVNQSDPAQIEAILKILSSLKITSVIKCEIKAGHCEELKSRDAVEIRGKRTYLVSGIGNPESFEKSVGSSGAMIVGHDKRADHFQYTEKNIAAFMKAAKGKNSEILLLTEKDAVKWEEFHIPSSGTLKIAKLLTTLEFNPPLPRIYDLALKRFC